MFKYSYFRNTLNISMIWLLVNFSGGCSNQKMIAANDQISKLNERISALNSQVDQLNTRLSDLSGQNAVLNQNYLALENKAEKCKAEKEAISYNMNELNRILQEQGNTLQEIRRNAKQALSAYGDRDIDVSYRNGMVYISMLDELMFPSGSAKVDGDGRKVLAVIAKILTDYPSVSAIVVGNTDTLMIAKGFRDNWSLSTERANTIVRILRDEYGTDPHRLTAAGKSKYHPVASNDTEEGRAKNRRTDIIINPDLSRLWVLSQKYP